LEQNQMAEGAYYGVARTSRVNLNSTDDYGITRIGMALAARSFDKGMVAPVLWYLIAGFSGVFVYAVIAGLAWRFGKDGFTSGFGAVPLALEKLLGFIPSILSAVLMSLASIITPTASIFKSMASWFSHRAPYEQGGLPLTAMAWTLNVTLGGATQDLNGSSLKNEWVGPKNATAKNDHKHLRRALYINVVAHLLFIAALLGAYISAGI
ncbi:MAG: cobalamin biosynthesis protein, partial [Alphaproteobacteria bacterium]